MAKKIFTYLAIILACGVLFVFGSFLLVFLAPGMEVFGVRYIAVGQGEYELDESEEYMPNFTGDIYIESEELPIYVSYEFIYNIRLEYKQIFVGLTKSDVKSPYVEYKVEDSNLYIKSHDLTKFLYSTDSGDGKASYLKLFLPYDMKSRSIFIKSNNSVININAKGTNKLETVDVTTNNDINISGNLIADKVCINTRKPININDNIQTDYLKVTAGTNSISINREFNGTLEVDANSSTLFLKSANKLIFKGTAGSIRPFEKGTVTVNVAQIETNSGNVNIDNITGMEESFIKTTSGTILIGSVNNLNLVNDRGPTRIQKAVKATIMGGVGILNVKEVTESISVETKNGNVTLGSDDTSVQNPQVTTTTGKILIKNAKGSANLVSKNSSVEIIGDGLTSLKIDSNEEVIAKGISGDVEINANGNVDVQIEKLSGDITINTTDGCKCINLDLTNYKISDFNYHFKSTKARLANIYIGEILKDGSKSEIKREPYIAGLKYVKIETTYADMNVYTK